jgi:hypothetical protein
MYILVFKKNRVSSDICFIVFFGFFFKGVGFSTLEELYGLTSFLIDPNHGLYESIGVHGVCTFNLKKTYCHGANFLNF